MPGRTWPVTTRQNSPPLTVSRQRRVAAAVLRVPGVLTCRTHTIQSQVNAVFFVLTCSHHTPLSLGRRALLRSPARSRRGKTWVLSFKDMFSPQARAARRLSVRAGGRQSPAQCCAAGDSEGAPTSFIYDGPRRPRRSSLANSRPRAQANTSQTRTQFQRSASRQNK